MAGFNISSFFNNSKGGFGSINFSDYSLIRSGSYKKLMKSYYSQQKETTPKADKTTKKKTTEVKDTTGLSKMKSEADGLKAATEAFNKDDLPESPLPIRTMNLSSKCAVKSLKQR